MYNFDRAMPPSIGPKPTPLAGLEYCARSAPTYESLRSRRQPLLLGRRLLGSSASVGDGDLAEVVRTAVINKRAGGSGLITGRKAFQMPMEDGVALLHAVQDVYLDPKITIA
jgi:hypothetical protein